MLRGSWRTSAIGILTLIIALATVAKAFLAGGLSVDLASLMPAVMAALSGLGLIVARDNVVTSEQAGAAPQKNDDGAGGNSGSGAAPFLRLVPVILAAFLCGSLLSGCASQAQDQESSTKGPAIGTTRATTIVANGNNTFYLEGSGPTTPTTQPAGGSGWPVPAWQSAPGKISTVASPNAGGRVQGGSASGGGQDADQKPDIDATFENNMAPGSKVQATNP